MRIFSPDPVDAEELVSPLEAPVPVRHAPGDDPGDVDGRVLLLAAHHVEAQPLLRLGKLDNPVQKQKILLYHNRFGCM